MASLLKAFKKTDKLVKLTDYQHHPKLGVRVSIHPSKTEYVASRVVAGALEIDIELMRGDRELSSPRDGPHSSDIEL